MASKKIVKSCVQCGAEFSVYPYRKDTAMCCSRKCAAIRTLTGRTVSRATRDKIRKAHLGKAASPEVREKLRQIHLARAPLMSGELNWNWNGGSSKAYKRGYKASAYRTWRGGVFVRDDYTCQGCKQRGGYLTAHHIKSFAHYPDLRYDISNGLTLCEPCHIQTDNYGGRGKRKPDRILAEAT